jgi:cytochrome c-type biogenesis protein CcmH
MMAPLSLIFGMLALAAVAFACWPVLRKQDKTVPGRAVLAAALAALVLGIGGGMYLMLGHPLLAVRSFSGPSPGDLTGLVAALADRIRERPNDPRGWILLGRGYLTVQDPVDAAAAFHRALSIAPSAARSPIYSAYGEALTLAAGGAVTTEAEAAFQNALRGDPKDFASRYCLGLAYASRRDRSRALAVWESLLADAPRNASWRAELADRIALLKADSSTPPDIGAMVATLAQRLKSHSEDAEGWQRLIRAYAVLGDTRRATQALVEGRAALRNDPKSLGRLALEARELKLEK